MTQPSLKHPGRWVWLLLLVPIAAGVFRLRFDAEVLRLLPPDLPVVQGLMLYQQHFANARQLIITLRVPEAEQAQDAAARIAAALRNESNLVASVTWQPPWMEAPEEMSELIAYLWFNQSPDIFGQWANRLSPEQLPLVFNAAREELATSLSPDEMAQLSYDPLGLTRLPERTSGATQSFGQGEGLFSSPDGKFRILFVQANQELRTYRQCESWLAAIRSLAKTAASSTTNTAPVSLGYTGRPVFVAEVASGMEHDMTYSVGGTAAIIAVLFWLAHRRIKPMVWLLTLLAMILGATLALGGLIYGTINVVSMGFAAILLGLAVDYAVVHYQEALAHPELTIAQVRYAIAPSIFWAAATTIAAFVMLNFGGLPGLGQLGTLVGLGVALSAFIMIFEFLPVLFPEREHAPASGHSGAPGFRPVVPRPRSWTVSTLGGTILVLGLPTGILLGLGLPAIDPTANALRPRRSPAYAALDEVQSLLSEKRQPTWLIVGGRTEAEVAARLAKVESGLTLAKSNGILTGFMLPTALWPQPENQSTNRAIASELATRLVSIRRAAAAAGFAERSLALTERVLQTWHAAAAMAGVFWPTNRMSQWVLEKVTARSPTNHFALGVVTLAATDAGAAAQMAQLNLMLPQEEVWLSGWELLGHSIFSRVKSNLWRVLIPMILLVLLSLWFAFQRPVEIILSVGALLLSGLCLLAVMRLANWSWNLLNLMAVPLILGTGVDYGIFMQSALRRHHGDLRLAHFAVGRALLLCGGTAVAGFGTLAWSSNAGMASLGQVCAVGIAGNMLLAVYLLPTWWRAASPVVLAKTDFHAKE